VTHEACNPGAARKPSRFQLGHIDTAAEESDGHAPGQQIHFPLLVESVHPLFRRGASNGSRIAALKPPVCDFGD